jgi:hypothetical protein
MAMAAAMISDTGKVIVSPPVVAPFANVRAPNGSGRVGLPFRTAMTRALLNALPEWALYILVVGVITLLSMLAASIIRRLLPGWRAQTSSGVVATVSSMVVTLFAVTLAFTVVNLYLSLRNASDDVASEASSLALVVRDVRIFPQTEQSAVQRTIGSYIREVVDHEFSAMRDGAEDPQSGVFLDDIFAALQAYAPQSSNQVSFYDSAVTQLNAAVADRRDRLAAAGMSLPPALTVLLLLTGAASIVTTFFLKIESLGLELALVSCVAIVVAAGLVTALSLEYPFSGSNSVSSAPFSTGALSQLPGP